MLSNLRKYFSKNQTGGEELRLPTEEVATFALHLGDLPVGELSCKAGVWTFYYTVQFQQAADQYHPIVGFPDLNKVYRSTSLWPFFLVRIPGLRQPAVREIMEEEKIDSSNEVALLKRFGRRTLANPFLLDQSSLIGEQPC